MCGRERWHGRCLSDDMNTWIRLSRDTRGATMVEYVVILALILIVAIKAWGTLGTNVNTKVDAAAKALQ